MSQLITCPQCQRSYPLGTLLCPRDGASLTGAVSSGSNVAPGLKVGDYVLTQKLGEGGMGEVWGARHPQIGKQVAIKLLSEKLLSSQKALARFMQEARAVNEIQHKNIVDIFTFGELPEGRPYFVMEFLKGQSLGDYLRERGPLPFSEILAIFRQVCSALQASHEHNIIHRDLKPDNLFLVLGAAPLFVKVLDFGIAKLESSEGESLTKSGAMMGTPAYMSPEQCEGAKTAEQASDIYSLGIILFELLTGRTPFRESDDGVGLIISKHMFMPAPAPSAMVSGRAIPGEVDAVVLRALAKKPKERFASCADLFDALLSAAAPLADETFEAITGAKPLYGLQSNPEPFESLVSEGLSKKLSAPALDVAASQTGDFYSSSPEGELDGLRPARAGGRSVGLVVGLLGVLFVVFWVVPWLTTEPASPVVVPGVTPSRSAASEATKSPQTAPSSEPAPVDERPASEPAKPAVPEKKKPPSVKQSKLPTTKKTDTLLLPN